MDRYRLLMFLTQWFYKFVSETQVGVTYFVMRIMILVGDRGTRYCVWTTCPRMHPKALRKGELNPTFDDVKVKLNKKLSWCWLLTNLRDAFIGQSRSSNIVQFHMLGIVSNCPIVTLCQRSLNRRLSVSRFLDDLEWLWPGFQGHDIFWSRIS